MIVRILKPEEKYLAQMVQAVAFEGMFDMEQAKAKCQEPVEKEAYAGSLPHDDRSPFTWAALSDDEREIYGCVGMTAFPVRFDGHVVLMGGVGGVATLPQHRRHGAIRECMKASFADMYEKGYVLSSLYPFSTAYYRQYGYEVGPDMLDWTIDMAALKLPDVGGKTELILPGQDLTDVLKVYNDCAAAWNTSSVREVYDEDMLKHNWMEQRRHLYLWRDEAGEPCGFIMFCKKDGVMDCTNTFAMHNNLMFRDARALTALLKFATLFAADYRAIKFTLPANIRVQGLISEMNKCHAEGSYNGMHRFVNVRKALEMCACRGEGDIRIGITDPMLPRNEGTWRIRFAKGQASIVEKTDETPDIAMPVGTFSQLLLGVRCAADLPLMPEVHIDNPDAPYEGIFYTKTCRMLDLF